MKSDNLVAAVFGMIFRAAFVIAAVYFIYRGTSICYDYGYRIFMEPPVSSGEGRSITVTTTKDMSPFDMGDLLEKKGLVRDGKLLALQYYCSEYRKDIKPGTYELSTAMTAEEMFQAMSVVAQEEDDEDAYDADRLVGAPSQYDGEAGEEDDDGDAEAETLGEEYEEEE